MIDKTGVLASLSPEAPVMLELGVGYRKRNPDAIGIDILDTPAVDIVGSALEVLKAIPDSSVSEISSVHVFEHLPDVPAILREVERVLATGGEMRVVVPHFSNPFYYSDPTHTNFFGLYTFAYYCEDKLFKRRVPSYARRSRLELSDIKLIFKSFPPRYVTHVIRKGFQVLFNLSNWTKEVYEDSWSRTISCYEVHYTVRKT